MKLPLSALKFLCLFLFALLAACSGGNEQPKQQQTPQQQAASQDTIPVDTVKTLEEKYPGYEIKHYHTEYFYEVDAFAPIIFSKVESWVREDLELIVYRHTDIRECRSAMDSLPKNIQEYMHHNNIVIPGFWIKQSHYLSNNVYLSGQFNENTPLDWAVMSYKDNYCWITVFCDGDTTETLIINQMPLIQGDGGRDVFRTMILVSNNERESVTFEEFGFFTYLSSSYKYYLWPESPLSPDSFCHDGFAEYSPENKGYFYYYFDKGKLLTWGNAMPGWEEWHEMNKFTMQDSMLLDPTLCKDIPPELAEEWRTQHYKLARLGNNPWCIKGDFTRKGQTDCLVWLFDESQYGSSYKYVELRLIVGLSGLLCKWILA